nr:ubiquitin carboxyl-terminal hydrolase puf [Leptinotarsa decemlineata]
MSVILGNIKMCDACSDFLQLLISYEPQFCRETNEQPILTNRDVDIVYVYVQTWPTRQCMCCYRDPKNLERFSYVTQGLIYMAASQLKCLSDKEPATDKRKEDEPDKKHKSNKHSEDEKENPEVIERDKLLILVSKIFLLNFPLYVAYKHTIQAKLDELTQQEMQNLNLFCDLHDSEIPIYLLKNVSWFCKMGGLLAMTTCFTKLTPELLPVSTAHAMISVVCNLKLWMNYKSMVSMLVPLRSCVLRYMCKLSDQDLRTPTIKSMADFMWNAIKDPLDSPVAFDLDGLDLAFKYFTSTTLTMRLAGITQINNQIGVLAEICVGESLPEAEAAPRHMADWLISNNIISHIFGPNLHVEVIKQSHIILNFLAMEGRITCEHMDVIWAAAQLKHCSKPVHDLLPGLVKHLAAAPTLHLYSLLTKLEPKDHTEQTLYLASALIKAIWSRGSGAPEIGMINVATSGAGIAMHKCSSSENSVSLDPTNSEEDHGDSSAQSESHKTDSEDIDGVEIDEDETGQLVDNNGPPPCKLAKKQIMERAHCEGSSTDTELDGIPIKTPESNKSKWTGQMKSKNEKRAHVRKKILTNLNVLPESVEAGPSSSSQDEADVEDSPSKMRKRRKLLRKTRVKRQKGSHKRSSRAVGIETLSEVDVDSDHDIKGTLNMTNDVLVLPSQMNDLVDIDLKPAAYLEESSSCSELGKESHDGACANFLSLHARGGHILEMLSGEEAEVEGDAEGSYSSRMSNKSEKNMADFDGEDSVCEEELARLTDHAHMNIHVFNHSPEKSPIRVDPRMSACFKVDNVCQPGNTLLWDLLQDDKICQLGEGLALEAEKTLCNLICYTPDKEIRMKFIEGCLNNLANNVSVVVSLRMLPKLLTSFRGLDMHHVTHWADRQHHMMTHFFNNLKVYTANPNKSLPMYTHQMQVQVRLHFLSAVFSPVVSPTNFKHIYFLADVSMAAIQYINSYYMGHNLQYEDQFVWQCMTHLKAASEDLASATGSEEASLLCIQRALVLMKTHIETFRRRYAFHLRKWALEGKGIGSHSAALGDRPSTPIRIIVQSGSSTERCFLDMLNTDYVADLRAEIVKWCEGIQQMKNETSENNKTKTGDTWIRIITQGQELTIDCEEKTLAEMGFKDNHMVYISVGMSRNMKKRECLDSPSVQPPPPRECLPTLLLLQPNYFEQLFSLMHTLSSMKIQVKGGVSPIKLFQSPNFSGWLQRLVLEDPEPAVRREACSAIYRLCLGISANREPMESSLVAPMLSQLLLYLEKAESMRPQKLEALQAPEEGKEPYGPACRDYFWLVSRLVDSLPDDLVKESLEDPQNCIIDINGLANKLTMSVLSRDYLETRHRTVDDDGLIGLLNLIANLLKHRPPFQTDKGGRDLLDEVFEFLFALPNPKLRHVPKCKSPRSRTAAFDLLVELVKGSPENYAALHQKLLQQHQPGPNSPYPWDYWPHEDGRSECGYVGLTNLGATCYMASCMQHLYMMPQARASILAANTDQAKHEPTLRELQRMFAYLLESERKAYNPRSFCKVYTMDHQPLNTAEQKDMAEFFIDLVSKLEEMTPDLKEVIKNLFCGVISNNVVSLDCDHVSRTLEEFYTVRCQVADMRNLYESLDEVTVKDTLEGDNMYTCSQCGKKVRAEKRACFKKLPHILCFNTMRYTFNMLTMLKEKVNTHFSFPLRLNMAGYVEKQLMPQHYQEEKQKSNDAEFEQYEYDLIGVTVHTGTADGGHYYSFIKDRTAGSRDKWFLFNDAEVKPFDPNQIAAECFGGEMTSKTYDSVTDKFMDFSFEKTNSAYMLFYERCPVDRGSSTADEATSSRAPSPAATIELSKELEDWIWRDNMHFIEDKNIFEHTYFNFMWQICGYIPQTLPPIEPNVTQKAAQLSTTFFIETFIHAKEKPTMVQWVELVTKQFNACQEACIWFLDHMAQNTWWPVQVLLKCPNQMVRQMFQRLCIHVIQRLKQSQSKLYLESGDMSEMSERKLVDSSNIGNSSCVTRFIRMLLSLMEHGAKAHLKHLTEYFGFLYEFSKMGEDESKFLLAVGAINTMVHFYLGQKVNDFVDVSEGEEEEEVVALPPDKYKPLSLDKMITLIASLLEKSRDVTGKMQLSEKDYNAIAGGKGFTFLYQQIKDNINLQQTRNLIHSLCKGNNQLAQAIICMISQAISRNAEGCQPFFKILTLLTETPNQNLSTSPSQPCFTQLVLQKVWDAAECCPYSALDWLALQVTRNRLVHSWVLGSMESWLEHFLIAHSNQRVRNTAGYLLVSLVPSTAFRQGFRATHRSNREPQLTSEAQAVLHQIYTALLRLLSGAKHYTDMQQHGTMKLTTYFALMMYCCISRTEKLMFGQYFIQLWHLFHPKLSEPSIPAYHNKQTLLAFWNHVCTDCPENVQLMLQNAHVTKNIAFNYILADHDDQEIVMYNRAMLPAYYGLLRMMCQQSRVFTRNLAQHQNLQWAFKNITPHPTQYPQAVEELFKLMQLMVMKHPDATETEQREIYSFRKNTLMTYLQCLDGRTSWGTLISAFRILLETNDDKLYVVYNGGLQIVFESFQNLHVMLHEATACHVVGDMLDILTIMQDLMQCIRSYRDNKDARGILLATKDWLEVLRKLATLLNTYNPPEMRALCIDVLKEFIVIMTPEAMQVLVPLLSHCHSAFQDSQDAVPLGPYFPRRGHSLPIVAGKGGARPLRPMVQMTVPHNQLECSRGIDPEYDMALDKFYNPYHDFIDMMFRLAVNNDSVPEVLINLSAVVGFESVPLHSTYFPKLWLDISRAQHIDRKYINMLTSCNYFVDYVDAILLDERSALTVDVIYDFLTAFFPEGVRSRAFRTNTEDDRQHGRFFK